ncbi:NAD(P)H-hydrate dehydratase [Gymnodinialimonas ceratoperidinii]|uniref:Bifunctional NAD(P)H-hydrate repair enzyme n=1 Tax=Gymnodinialimonas ceratoperidinii TaxID=2856823 RepID=A0A8F6YC86_9RHOB|nr:NAD(P)H-hydrate dehydratase [Gymnodinialimonas ceratoperidinii]QXT38962.1 NAD(P)H-hydrate dehydratase [Gymnodinialimonas ceratoperidinii]
MTEVVTAAQMRGIESAAIEAGAVTGAALMERAGAGVVAAILRQWPEAQSATILCGPGNNGGDGYVIARLLAERWWDVRVLGMGDAEAMPPDARANRAAWQGEVAPLTRANLEAATDTDIVVDAIFGTGLTRAPAGEVLSVLKALGDCAAPLVAVDAPSGLCLDRGIPLAREGSVPKCDLTVTFEVPKIGHFIADGPACCGALEVVDLGLSHWRGKLGADTTRLIDAVPMVPPTEGTPHILPNFRKKTGHKYDNGHALVVSGGPSKTGAARLAARAALRIGAGLVTVASPPTALAENAMQLTAIMTRRCGGAAGLSEILEDARFTALCLGPSLGVGEQTRAMVRAALGPRFVVLDADALTSFEEDPSELFEAIAAVGEPERVILTPHGGEFGRLFPDENAALDAGDISKLDAVREAAQRSGAVVLLKGADTVIASPDGRSSIHAAHCARSVPWLATAGAGDVLAGLIAGLAARSDDLHRAAADATWLHVEAARAFGPGLIAEDLPEMVPRVLRDMGV